MRFKRARLTNGPKSAFGGLGPGRFDDLAELTIFADNLVPHVLRARAVYASGLAARSRGSDRDRMPEESTARGLRARRRVLRRRGGGKAPT